MTYLFRTCCLWSLTATFALTGCTPYLFSPPANIAPMETVRTHEPGKTTVAGFAGGQKLDFGPRTTTISASVRHGLGHGFDLGLDLNYLTLDTERAVDQDLNGSVGSARIGAKWAPLGNFFALTAGFGAGTHTAGQFIAPDLGLVLALENPYLIPFLNLSGFISQPLNARTIDFSYDDQEPGTHLQAPAFTWGTTWTLGLKLPLHNVSNRPIAPYFGVTGSTLLDGSEDINVIGFTAGLDIEIF